MRALVTGAAGFIGSRVVAALAERAVDVVATDRPGTTRERLGGVHPRVTFEATDLRDPEATAALVSAHRPDLLVHMAWYARPEDYLTSRENLASLSATATLLAAAVDAGCARIVGAGTCLEYPESALPHRECDPAGPTTLYGACKHAARLVGERLADGRASFAWARLFHLYGPGEDPRRLVPMVANKLRRGEPVDLSPGEQVRDYLRVEDVADAIATVALSEACGTVNVCSGTAITLREFLGALAHVMGRPDLLRFGRIPYRVDDRMRIAGDPGVLTGLGWTPRHSSLNESLEYLAS
jgi:dTDP-6-deoxy-L-talose 4-dehydrogenase (NAD+)